jgi:hypothetical protein
MAVGLGGEQLWLSPTVANNVNPFDDQSGQGNNGTAQGGLSTVADTGSGGAYAYDFDGTNDYIDITGYANSKTAYSLSTWINGTGPNQTVVAFNVGDSSGLRSLNLGLQPSATALAGHQASPSFYWAESTSTVNGAGWKHVAATYDGSDVKIYVDGVLEDTQAAPNSTTAQTRAFIGRWVGSTPFWLTGKMDDIRAYDRPLTQSEISWLATERGVLGTPPEGLGDEQLWLCPSIQDSANDLSGNGNNGVYQNGMGTITDTAEGGSLAYDLDGSADYIRVPKANFDFLVETNSFSQSVWVKSDATGQRCFIGGDLGSSGKNTGLFQDSNVIRANRSVGSGSYSPNTISTTAVPISQWTHFAWVVDNTTSTLYMDGVQIFQETGTFTTVTGPLVDDILVGCYSVGSSFYSFLDGLVDDVRIYNRALTQAEITHLATSRGVLGPPGGATHYNPFKSHAFINDFQQRLR